VKALDSEYGPVRERAAETLGAIGDAKALPYLVATLKRKHLIGVDNTVGAVAAIAKSVAKSDVSRVRELLEPLFVDRSARREHVAERLLQFDLGSEMNESLGRYLRGEPWGFVTNTELRSPVAKGHESLLEESIEHLHLSVRAFNALSEANITTIGQVLVRSKADLMKYRGLGRGTVDEIDESVNRLGLELFQPSPS
jgi:hypothetical protein